MNYEFRFNNKARGQLRRLSKEINAIESRYFGLPFTQTEKPFLYNEHKVYSSPDDNYWKEIVLWTTKKKEIFGD